MFISKPDERKSMTLSPFCPIAPISERSSPLYPIQFHVNWPRYEPRPSRQNVEFLTFIQTEITREVLTAQRTETLRLDCTNWAVYSENHRTRVNTVRGQWQPEILKCRGHTWHTWHTWHTQFPERVKKNQSTICRCPLAKDNRAKFILSSFLFLHSIRVAPCLTGVQA